MLRSARHRVTATLLSFLITLVYGLAASLAIGAAWNDNAQAQGAPPPPRLEPIAEPPPPTIGIDIDTSNERGVRLSPGADNRVEDLVIDGKRNVRVANPDGSEYYLIEDLGDGTVTGQNSQDSRIRTPRWLILSF